jgi:hypothetical protein
MVGVSNRRGRMRSHALTMGIAFSLSVLGACALDGYEEGAMDSEGVDEMALGISNESADRGDVETAETAKAAAAANLNCSGYPVGRQGLLTCTGDPRCVYRGKALCDRWPLWDYERLGSAARPGSGSPSVATCDSGHEAVAVWLSQVICPL